MTRIWAAVGGGGEFARGIGGVDHDRIRGRALRKGVAARVDPARREGQRGEREHERAADMAGAGPAEQLVMMLSSTWFSWCC